MSSSKRNSCDNHSPLPESEGETRSSSKSRGSSKNENNADESTSSKISRIEHEKLSLSVNELTNSTETSEDAVLPNLNDSAKSPSSEPGTSISSRSSDSKSNIHLSPSSKHLSAGDSPVFVPCNSPVFKDNISDKFIDNQFVVDGVSSPGNASQEASLFPDNLSRSSESGKSIDLGAAKIPEAIRKADISKLEKSLKTSEKKEKKKPAWYNVLNPTYKSRSDDFKRLFKELPDSERLIVDYSCALQKDILHQGRLYVSENYICFYSNIFRWENFVLIRCRDVTSITKERTARVIPNAIQITTDSEKHFFTSFAARDKTFLMLFRIWQNALLEQPMSSQELWQYVHHSYGEELGLTSEDDDYVAPLSTEEDFKSNKLLESGSAKDSEKGLEKALAMNPCDSSGEYIIKGHQFSHEATHGFDGSHDPLVLGVIDEDMLQAKNAENSLNNRVSENPTDMSDTTESEEIDGIEVKCPCASHEGKELLNAVFPMSIDQIFSLIFTGSKFYYDLLASRKTYDIMDSPWQICPELGLKVRQVTYTVTLNHSMAKSTHTTETQRMLKHSKPGQVYTIDCDVVNTGIPYCDAFMVKSVYCLTRVSKHECRLRVFGGVHYKKKPMWGLVTSLIEKSAMQGLADFATDLDAALTKEAECSSQQGSTKLKRRKRIKIDPGKCDNVKDAPRILQRQPTLRKIGQSISSFDFRRVGSNPDLVIIVILATLLVLLFLNMLLFYKLWSLEDQNSKVPPPPVWEFSVESLSNLERDDVLQLLKKQDILHRAETEKWRDALGEVMKLIHLVESSLAELRSSIDIYSSNSVLKNVALRNANAAKDSDTQETSQSSEKQQE